MVWLPGDPTLRPIWALRQWIDRFTVYVPVLSCNCILTGRGHNTFYFELSTDAFVWSYLAPEFDETTRRWKDKEQTEGVRENAEFLVAAIHDFVSSMDHGSVCWECDYEREPSLGGDIPEFCNRCFGEAQMERRI